MTRLLLIGLLGTIVFSCQKEDFGASDSIEDPTPIPYLTESSECEQSFDLLAGQTTDAGDVTVSNDDNYIYVTFNTTGGWVLNETHVYVGEPSGIPTNSAGNPQIGTFPYNDTHDGETTFTVVVPIDPNLECYAVAAHASVSLIDENGNVIQSETAWGNGPQVNNGGSWATYSDYCLLECTECEFETVSYEFYGGQHILIGSLDVTNDQDSLYVTFNFTGDWYMGQTHLYVGEASGIPTNGAGNPIPGQFPYSTTHNPAVQSYTYTIALDDLPDCYAIAAHAESMLVDENGDVIQTETGWSNGVNFSGNNWGWYSEYCTQICE